MAERTTYTLRSTVSTDDTDNPAYSTGVNLGRNYKTGFIEITLGGTTPSWDITPLYDNIDDDDWAEGSTLYGVSGDDGDIIRKKVNLSDVKKFQIRVDGSDGTNPTISAVLACYD